MAEENNQAGAQQGQFTIQKIYCKDVSFETPNSPAIFGEAKWEPEVNVQLNSRAAKLENDMQEVVLTVTITAKVGDKVRVNALVTVGRDFGMGYSYDLILEEAKIEAAKD